MQLRNDYVDTLYMARKCLPQLSHHRLGDVCEYFGIGTEGAHRALNDCIMNQKCYEKLGELLHTDHEVVKDHVAYSDKQGNFYCRAAHGILNYKEDQQVCGRGCPCFVGTDGKGYPVCRYQSLESLEKPTRSPMVMYKRMQQAITDGYVPLFPKTQRMTELYPAYAYAARAHQGQTRKGTQIPYITHLLTTMNYCLQLTDDKDVLMAAILHDTIEDTDTTYEDILHHFGPRIADYVREETENKRENLPAESTWEIRKRETIEHLRTASIEVKMLVLPGGMPGTIHLKEHKGLEKLILKHNEEKKYLAAICAAPTVFGGMGILKGKKAICYPGMEEGLTGAEVTCQPAVTDGHITTSRGLGTAIDFALALISELRDKESADTISKQVVYER